MRIYLYCMKVSYYHILPNSSPIVDFIQFYPWYANKMVAQNMLRTGEEKYEFSVKMFKFCDCSQSKQMPLTDQITDFNLHVLFLTIPYHKVEYVLTLTE